MKYIKTIFKIVYIIFGIATAGMLIMALVIKKDEQIVNRTFGYYDPYPVQ